MTVFQCSLPNVGPGALKLKEAASAASVVREISCGNTCAVVIHVHVYILQDATSLSPSVDFYKTLALECSTQQIGVDLFVLTGQYVDLATICEYDFSVPYLCMLCGSSYMYRTCIVIKPILVLLHHIK